MFCNTEGRTGKLLPSSFLNDNKAMAIKIPNLNHALNSVADENGFIPFSVAKFAATAAAVDISFEQEYADVCTLADQMGYTIGIEAEEFCSWLTTATEK